MLGHCDLQDDRRFDAGSLTFEETDTPCPLCLADRQGSIPLDAVYQDPEMRMWLDLPDFYYECPHCATQFDDNYDVVM